jgi:hypothetical protein
MRIRRRNGYRCILANTLIMPATHHTSSSSRVALNSESIGEDMMGASVVLNFHVPMPSDVARAAAETASLQSLSAGQNPGTISISTTKNRKRSVASTDETLYVDNRRPLLSESLGSLVPVLESLSIAVPPRFHALNLINLTCLVEFFLGLSLAGSH